MTALRSRSADETDAINARITAPLNRRRFLKQLAGFAAVGAGVLVLPARAKARADIYCCNDFGAWETCHGRVGCNQPNIYYCEGGSLSCCMCNSDIGCFYTAAPPC